MPQAKLLILDTEVNHKGKIESLGLIDEQGKQLYKGQQIEALLPYLEQGDFLVGHNILKHDLQFLLQAKELPLDLYKKPIIDTLWLASLIFIRYPSHALVKDYKLNKQNDPIEDSRLCLELFQACEKEFLSLEGELQQLLFALLGKRNEFQHFFVYLQAKGLFIPKQRDLKAEIRSRFTGFVQEAFFEEVLEGFLQDFTLELAYVIRLLLIKREFDRDISILPAWIVHNLPAVHQILQAFLKYKIYDAKKELKRFFGYDEFRSFETADGKQISQQEVVEAALRGEDLLAIFSTGGGKSLTFQLPALMMADQMPYLTLVISPLQSLMKDQVDVLNHRHHISNVGYLNSTLDPLERKEVFEKVEFGGIDLLYLSPEMLRSQSTIHLLSKRLIARIVIDEAHCFSKWGHDFRIDYMFIADFVKALSKKNKSLETVKISCFTATGKKDVTEEIKAYFKDRLGNELREFRSVSARSNLHYEVLESKDEDQRFKQLLELLENRVQSQPCIIFTRYTGAETENLQGARNLAAKINETLGFELCSFYHGKMKAEEKRRIQDDFINGGRSVIVATNAFGMGVDKQNVRFVIHYGIPSSLENYLQEAGRAGRDKQDASCIILYHSEDINANLQLNKSGEVRQKEINALWTSIKNRAKKLNSSTKILCKSAKELIKDAGWIGEVNFDEDYRKQKIQQETKMKTALFFLEKFGFIKREFNRTKVRATANTRASLSAQYERMDQLFGALLPAESLSQLKAIYKLIKSSKIIAIEDINVGLPLHDLEGKKGVKSLVNLLRLEHFIEQDDEISLVLNPQKHTSSLQKLADIDQLGSAFLSLLPEQSFEATDLYFDKLKLNTELSRQLGEETLAYQLDLLLLHFKKTHALLIKGDQMRFLSDLSEIKAAYRVLVQDAEQFLQFLLASDYSKEQKSAHNLVFVRNLKQLHSDFSRFLQRKYSVLDLENLLRFLHRFEIIRIEGGLFLYQTKFQIKIGENPPPRFTKEQYADLEAFYQKKTEQAHIMDTFARRLQEGRGVDHFVEEYFTMDYGAFLDKYFKNRKEELRRPLSKEKYQQLYHSLSPEQQLVLKEKKENLLLLAGPGAGKTKTLVHKVASLILEDGIRKEEFLLLTFSRSAKFELKKRIIELIGNQGYYLEIDTFHGYALKLLAKEPNAQLMQEDGDLIIKQAIAYLKNTPALQLPYSVLVLDEFQDVNDYQFELITQIKEHASRGEEMKALAAGDDDQSIFGYAGGNIKHIQAFKQIFQAKEQMLTANYRSTQALVDFTSAFIQQNPQRLKQHIRLVSARTEQEAGLFSEGKTKIQTIDLAGGQLFAGLSQLLGNAFFQQQLQSGASVAILFHNNETGLIVDTFLKKQGYATTLLLKEEGYTLTQTLEFAEFLTSCEDEHNPVSLQNIQEKFTKILTKYGENKNTQLLRCFVQLLCEQNRYLTPQILKDASRGLTEKDLLQTPPGTIVLSTFHKAKGLEFDTVMLCCDEDFPRSEKRKGDKKIKEELIRLLYVAMTRAKNHLFLLGNAQTNPFFHALTLQSPEYIHLENLGQTKKEIGLLTSCKQVNLGYHFYNKVHLEDAFPIGTPVERAWNSFWNVDFLVQGQILQSSSRAFAREFQKWLQKGYQVKEITVFQRLAYFLRDKQKTVLVYLFKIVLEG